MSEIVPAREANQNFSRLLREVEKGQDFVVTKNGKPVARVAPVHDDELSMDEVMERAASFAKECDVHEAAQARALMLEGWSLGGKAPSRDELYDR